jgi:hypothetical protein
MITNHHWRNKSNCPKKQSFEEKKLISLLMYFHGPQNLCYSFPFIYAIKDTEALSSTQQHFKSVADSLSTSIQVNYLSRHNPRQPKSIEENIPQGTGDLTME